MTIDEVIAHEREVAKDHREKAEYQINRKIKSKQIDLHIQVETEQAEEHEQLAEWLEELKELRKIKEDYAKGMQTSYATFMYNKAINDFAERLSKHLGVENATKYGNKNAEQQKNSYDTVMKYEIADAIDDVAEQLKEG